VYHDADWFRTSQLQDRSAVAAQRRVYHKSYQTSSGHTFDHLFDETSRIAAEIENAGISLGWKNGIIAEPPRNATTSAA
jgi:hypothetical protein